jgi:Dolichyl-phosphate-mannose-protein mannosyltransferase
VTSELQRAGLHVPSRVRWSARAASSALPATVAVLLCSVAALLTWNAIHYDWLRGYDAWQNWRYEQAIAHGHLPSRADTDEWHNPPLFYAAAYVVQSIGGEKSVQFIGVVSGIGLVLFAFLIARELFSSATARIGALAFAAATPVLVRGSVMYHPEPLASLLVAAAVFVFVRALARRRSTVANGVLAGGLVGLACLTRTWALAALLALGIVLLAQRSLGTRRMFVAFAASALLLTVPWLVYKGVRFGSPVAYSQPNPAQWQNRGRPASFYVGLSVPDVFSAPYSPRFRNQLLPVLYTDWWGDYWRYFRVPATMIDEPARLPSAYHRQLVEQSFVGILPSLLALVGLVGLAWTAVARRSAALSALVLPLALLGVSFVAFLVKYPKLDGDNIKALYVLNAAVPLAVCAGWALDRVRSVNRLLFAGVVLLLLDAAFFDIRFLVLPS